MKIYVHTHMNLYLIIFWNYSKKISIGLSTILVEYLISMFNLKMLV